MKCKIILMVLLVFSFFSTKAQSAFVAAGSETTGAGGSFSYSVGQMPYKYYTSAKGSATEGVQQSYEISVYSQVENLESDFKLIAFPNPTSNYLTLEITGNEVPGKMSYSMLNSSGKFVLNQVISANKTLIEMRKYPAGIYFLSVNENKKSGTVSVKTFKIIKK